MANSAYTPEMIQKMWGKKWWKQVLAGSFFQSNGFIGNTVDSIIVKQEEFGKNAGDTITISYAYSLTKPAVVGANMLVGNEDELTWGNTKVVVDLRRMGVPLDIKAEQFKSDIQKREVAKDRLTEWGMNDYDGLIFNELSKPATPNRVLYGGTAASEATLAVGDIMTPELISKAKRKAKKSNPKIRPVMIKGKEWYVMVMAINQARDLRTDARWEQIQANANVRSEENPLFTGALGVWDGVILHEHDRVLETLTGASGIQVGHALLLGKQAGAIGVNSEQKMIEGETEDYKRIERLGIEYIAGATRPDIAPNNTGQVESLGLIKVLTASVDD